MKMKISYIRWVIKNPKLFFTYTRFKIAKWISPYPYPKVTVYNHGEFCTCCQNWLPQTLVESTRITLALGGEN